jgi:hypothetical protein
MDDQNQALGIQEYHLLFARLTDRENCVLRKARVSQILPLSSSLPPE